MEDLLLVIAAVIVTFNSEIAVRACLEALSDMAPSVLPIVVDNASQDRTVEQATNARAVGRAVRVIANAENRGFAAAANQGARAAFDGEGAEFVLLLNPDANLLTSVEGLVSAARQHGIAAGQLIGENGRAQTGFTVRRFPTPWTLVFETLGINRLWPSNPVNRQYRYLDRDLDLSGRVEQPAGAFLLVRRDVWERLGGLDEGFHPVWFEDVDFCFRASQEGYAAWYVPTVKAAHAGGHSVGQVPPRNRAVYWCVSLLRYAGKHFGPTGYREVAGAVVLSSIPRMVAGMIHERNLSPVATYSRIVRLAVRCLMSREMSMRGTLNKN